LVEQNPTPDAESPVESFALAFNQVSVWVWGGGGGFAKSQIISIDTHNMLNLHNLYGRAQNSGLAAVRSQKELDPSERTA